MRSDVQKLHNLYGSGLGAGFPGFVEDSWVRCLDSYNLVPDNPVRPAILTHGELAEATQSNEDLIRAGTPEVERLFCRLSHGKYIVSLASSQGVKLVFRCDPYLIDDLGAAGVTLGSNWAEEVEGTNGIGTSLKTGRALSIVGDQHFHVVLKGLTCTVAPILGTDRRVLGALNVTSLQPEPPRAVRILRDVVERAATRIEMQLFRKRHRGWRLVSLGTEAEFSDSAASALVALDELGRVRDLSPNAVALLGPQRTRQVQREGLKNLTLPEGLFAQWEPVAKARTSVQRPKSLLNSQISPLDPRQTELLRKAEQLIAGHQPILIQGAAGVGKSTFAKALAGARHVEFQSVLLIDGTADPNQTLHRLRDLDPTEECTLILDNLADMTSALQLKLLGIVDSSPVLTLAVTGTPLADLIAQNTLRPDLAHRLSGSQLTLPALHDAPGLRDIIKTLFDVLARAAGRPELYLTEGALATLTSHHWPGNLHEMKASLRHAILMAKDQVTHTDLPDPLRAQAAEHDLAARSQHEAARIIAALQHNNGNVAETARYLGLSRATLYRKIQISKIREK